ncbi:MAG: TonB-dependent receptor [Bacteroidia bacterium]
MEHFYKYVHGSEVKRFKLASFFILFFIYKSTFAQTNLKGTVKDSATQETLVGVIITVDSNQHTSTDLNGHYQLNIGSGVHTITFSYLTYQSKTIQINGNCGEINYDIMLQSLSQGLQMTVVTASMYGKNIQEENVSMEVMDAQTVQNTSIHEIDEAMNNMPGVTVVDGQANIRGGSGWAYGVGSRVLVLVDGLPELTPDAGYVIWDFLPMEQLQQIEVIKGASSALYGSSALNGVINVRTAYPTSTPVTTFSFSEGIYGNPKVSDPDSAIWWRGGQQQPYFSTFSFMHSRKIGQLDFIFSGNMYNEKSYLEGAYDQRARLSLTLRYRFKHIDGLMAGIKTNFMYQNDGTFLEWANDSSGIIKPQNGTGPGTSLVDGTFKRLTIVPFINYYAPDGSRYTFQAKYFLSSDIDYGYGTQDGSVSYSYYYELQYQKDFKYQFTLTAGLVESTDNVNAELYGNRYAINQAAYLQLEKKIGKRFSITAGLRYETNKVDSLQEHSPVVYRAGANYRIAKATYLRASYGEGYRFPSIAEKYVSTTIGGALPILPNPGLNPETGYSGEVGVSQGLKMGDWQGYADLALFATEYRNMIDFSFNNWATPSKPTNLGFKSVNIENAQITGAELTYTASGKIFGIPVQLMAGVTATDPINVDTAKKVNSYEASHPELTSAQKDSLAQTEILNYRSLYTAKLGIEVTYKKFTFGGIARYNSFMVNVDWIFEQNTGIINGVEQFRQAHDKGDLIIDAHIGYQVSEAVKASFIVKNMFNDLYMIRPGLIGPPQNFTIQLNIRL